MKCPNCTLYRWPQPDDKSSLKQCSKCKVVIYCSKECQKEHWEKVHKKQCKYLAKEKVFPLSRHDQITCQGCKDERETGGLDEMAKLDNPILGCYMSKVGCLPVVCLPGVEGDISEAPLPFQLGEMSGKFQTKQEHTISIILHIMYKMKLTRHNLWTICPQDMDCLWKSFSIIRNEIWRAYIMSSSLQVQEDKIRGLMIPSLVEGLKDQASMINSKLTTEAHELDEFQPWNTLLLLLDFLLTSTTIDAFRIVAEAKGLPEMSLDIEKIRLTSVQFNTMWQQLLDSMKGKLIPYTTAVRQLCGGSLNQTCVVCAKNITVERVITSTQDHKVPGLFFSVVSTFYCGYWRCNIKIGQASCQLFNTYIQISTVCKGSICDGCHLPSTKIHRCTRCLTKQYCGVQCRDKDWAKVHSQVCRNDEIIRKRKGGQEKRKEEGQNYLDFSKELWEAELPQVLK